ncbi:MAG: glycoside hydrolase family 3 N-terminal domain-containing protein [Candidatus Borkfalkiaceae bacterium]|nr:glycoside hydrolase family 3 N-terminal domain-containing protein [Christensenellaceae bacterium]
MEDLKRIIDSMTVEQLCGQVLAYDIQPRDDEKETLGIIEKIKPGALFVCGTEKGSVKDLEPFFRSVEKYRAFATEKSGVPCLMTTDIENGPGSFCKPLPELPNPMAWGACDDEKLVERAGELTGRICRRAGIHYTLGPVVDLSLNFRNPLVSVRSVSDSPDRVIKIAGAYLRGVQKNGYLAGCLKHFPGDGVDERNQHFLTSVNSLSKEEWMSTYGRIYKELFAQGADSVMVGHIGCPAFQSGETDEYGVLPATLSKSLITDLLKGELGFKGCVISDAMSMIGACARVPEDKLAVSFFKAGGDLMLFPRPEEHGYLVQAVKSGELSEERIKDAAYRCLKLKEKARLFDENFKVAESDFESDVVELGEVCREIAEKAVKIVRNNQGILPVKKEKGKVLLLKFGGSYFNTAPQEAPFRYIESEFKNQGWQVDSLFFAKHERVKEIMNDYDLIVIASHSNYHGSTLRVGWDNIMALWRGYVLQHKRVVFVGLDDPYKLFDFPYAKTYINTFGTAPELQKALVKVILGKIRPQAKNPIEFKGFFDRED